MSPLITQPLGTVRLVASVVPITLLLIFWGLILLISLSLSEARRQYVLDLNLDLVKALSVISGQPTARIRRRLPKH